MSIILNALKKIEKAEEKKGLAPRSTTAITREILREDLSRRRSSRYLLPLVFGSVLALGVGAGVLFVRTDELPPLPVAQSAPVKSADLAASVPPPLVEIPAVVPAQTAEPVSAPSDPAADSLTVAVKPALDVASTMNAISPVPEDTKVAAPTKSGLPDRVIAPVSAAKETSVRVVKKSKGAVAPPVFQSKPQPTFIERTVATVASTPRSMSAPSSPSSVVVPSRTDGWLVQDAAEIEASDLRVSEIHWRPAAKERLAVVNDLPVLEGVDIEGVRVDRIFKDRIRFVANGRYLEVKLSSKPASSPPSFHP